MHLLNEKEYQDYCAYKKIEPQIKGCLDRERELEKKLEEKEKEIKSLKIDVDLYKTNHFYRFYLGQDKVKNFCVTEEVLGMFEKSKKEFAIAQLKNVEEWFIQNSTHDENNNAILIDYTCSDVLSLIDNQINQLKEGE